jgi:hypothetical protein
MARTDLILLGNIRCPDDGFHSVKSLQRQITPIKENSPHACKVCGELNQMRESLVALVNGD